MKTSVTKETIKNRNPKPRHRISLSDADYFEYHKRTTQVLSTLVYRCGTCITKGMVWVGGGETSSTSVFT